MSFMILKAPWRQNIPAPQHTGYRLTAATLEMFGDREPVCQTCMGCGWESYSLGFCDPHTRECTECGNPDGNSPP